MILWKIQFTQKVLSESQSKIISIFNTKTLIYTSGIAAAVLLLFNLSIFNSEPSFDSLKTETVENYLISEGISSYEIASLLTAEELNENKFVDLNLEKNNIETYLLNNVDIEDLMVE